MDKLRLDFYLSVGGELTKGDECYNVENEEANEFIGIVGNDEMYPGCFQFDGKGYGIYSKEYLKQLVITSFAERENKGVQPVPDDFPVVVTTREGIVSKGKASVYNFKINSFMSTWKPGYEALLKMQAEHDKPTSLLLKLVTKRTKKESEVVYTQKMKDNGTTVNYGMRFLDGSGQLCTALAHVYSNSDSMGKVVGHMYEHPDCNHVPAISVTNFKDISPIKSPEEIEQENKIKEIHSKLLQSGFEVELSAVKFLNKNYIITDK